MKIALDAEKKPSQGLQTSLGELIQRITHERGPFTNLSEEDIAQEVDSQAPAEDSSTDKNDNDETSFEKSRVTLLENVRSALNEAALSLDLVSLLVSGLRPQAGAASVSPMLKHEIPMGSLSSDSRVIENSGNSSTSAPAAGWKLNALTDAADRLTSAENRLRGEINKEATFWKQVIDTVDDGEVIIKQSQGDKRGLQIKYGFGDSGSTYFEPGIGRITRLPSGAMSFEPQSAASNNAVRVSIYQSAQTVDLPQCQSMLVKDQGNEIVNARNFLFEDELYFRLIEEARTLAGHRVRLNNNRIICELYGEVIEIDKVPVNTDSSSSIDTTSDYDEDMGMDIDQNESSQTNQVGTSLADVICASLHILLAHHHHENLKKQHTVPSALTSTSRSPDKDSLLPILKPVLAWRQHSIALNRTKRLLEMMSPGTEINITNFNDDEKHNTSVGLLLSEPKTLFEFKVGKSDISLWVKSPLAKATVVYEAQSTTSKASFFDLTELEGWVKWCIQESSPAN